MTKKEIATLKDVIAELEMVQVKSRHVEMAKLMLKNMLPQKVGNAKPIAAGLNPIPVPKDPIKTDK